MRHPNRSIIENFWLRVLLFEFLIIVDAYLEVILVKKKVVFTVLVIIFSDVEMNCLRRYPRCTERLRC